MRPLKTPVVAFDAAFKVDLFEVGFYLEEVITVALGRIKAMGGGARFSNAGICHILLEI